MVTKLTFLGAAGNVTGSRYLVEVDDTRVLIDCGMHQERELRSRDWAAFPVPPESIDAIVLSHAHLDHCGLLPKLVREGFRGRVYCTDATAEIAEIVLFDAARLQMEDAEFKKKRHEREGRRGPYPEMPLYNTGDVEACLPYFSPVGYKKTIRMSDHLEARLYDAGHVLGSAMIMLTLRQNGKSCTMLFSGDLGSGHRPVVQEPTYFTEADYVVVESTYGDRVTPPQASVIDQLADVVNATARAGGNIVIPSFAVERAQEVLYYLNKLLLEDRIPHLPVFVDSPMAVEVIRVFERHAELYDEEMADFIRKKNSPFHFAGLNLVTTVDESKAINHIRGTAIIIAGSGMCTGGRIKHHLVANITRPESAVLFVGYQAVGTLGRQIVDGAEQVRILGQQYPVRARIAQIHGFSAHADRDQLLAWLMNLQRPPRQVFVIHGESSASHNFARVVTERTGWKVAIPGYQDGFVLD